MKNKNINELVEQWLAPMLQEHGLSLWDIEFKKEGPDWFLRVFIDAQRPIGTEDCEKVSRHLEAILDKEDPIEQSYYLEVSSPGIERVLKKSQHFLKFIGHQVQAKLYKELNGSKSLSGELVSFENNNITIDSNGNNITFDLSEAALIKLVAVF